MRPRPSGKGVVKSYRYGLFRPGNSRFVIDLNSPVRAAEPMILPPSGGYGYRVVLDLFPTTQAVFDSTAGWPADMRAKEAAAETLASIAPPRGAAAAEAPHDKKIVVIDAGHGGIDSGTIGVDGSMEKDLVLDEAIRLGRELERRGYTVHLTRNTDIYIPLRERVNIARGYDADLFISLHADSNPDTSVEGMSVYTLSESGSDKEAAALARQGKPVRRHRGRRPFGRQQPGGLHPHRPRPARDHEPFVTFCRDGGKPALPRHGHFAARSAPFRGLCGAEGARCACRPDRIGLSFQLLTIAGQMGTDIWRNGVAGRYCRCRGPAVRNAAARSGRGQGQVHE